MDLRDFSQTIYQIVPYAHSLCSGDLDVGKYRIGRLQVHFMELRDFSQTIYQIVPYARDFLPVKLFKNCFKYRKMYLELISSPLAQTDSQSTKKILGL